MALKHLGIRREKGGRDALVTIAACRNYRGAVSLSAELRELVHCILGRGAKGTQESNSEMAELEGASPFNVLGDARDNEHVLLT